MTKLKNKKRVIVIMPDHETHCQHTLTRYGVRGDDIHSYIDEPCKVAGRGHRVYRHDTKTIKLIGEIFGAKYGREVAENIALDHITADHEEEIKRRNITVQAEVKIPIINTTFEQMLFPSIEQANSKNPSIICNYLIVYGSQGNDKASIANSIAGLSIDKFGRENVCASFSEQGALSSLLHRGFEPKLVNVLFADNLTYAKISNDSWRDWCTLTQYLKTKIAEDCELNLVDRISTYYIIAIIGLDRYSKTKSNLLRPIVNGIIVKDNILDLEDIKVIRSYFSDIDLREFISNNNKKETNSKANQIFISRTEKGFLNLPLRDEFLFKKPISVMESIRKYYREKSLKKQGYN